MLKVENLVVSYGHINALRGISFEVNQGEIISLIGANGAGKTTALMAVSNLAGKESGRISFMDRDITAMPPHKIVKMGICHVPEGRKIFPELTVYENMISGSFGNPNLGRERMDELVEEQFTMFPRLRERRNQAGGTLSGGEQQMLAIARGLMMDPKIIMLDEPSLGLAPIVVEEIFELIQKIRDYGKTILLIEQNASMALSIANRGYVLENGTVTLTGSGRDLLSDREVQRAYLGA
ncbi:ABC transporter ATP-binding protein [Enterocloster sp. OA13]|uniref:ABC transporter ATP-binding protein n=1 Tax=Enterocloster TaxID=2719313 RepID=UPI00046EAFC8|nr:ABC transporter ATP-binding protein [Lachnoclostridium pacaense]MCC2879525.1 ABC transporter ATP-binding protein [Lachnoclostridium pacaense]MCH1952344.1 ABC transporter ATP-binding protein [Enterocloster sp. OA13]